MAAILVLSELFLPTKGGTAVWAAEVYPRLGGKEIHIVTADVAGARQFDAAHPNTVHRLRLRRLPWLRPESLAIYGRLFAASLLSAVTHRFDAVHAFRALPEGLVGWLVARGTFRDFAIYAHGEELTGWGNGAKYRTMRFALRRADQVIANSEHTRETLRAMGVADDRIVVIHPGVDVAAFRPGLEASDLRARLGIAPLEKLVLSVGRLARRKGFDQVIRAVARLRQEGIPLHYAIAGIGEDASRLDALAGEHNLAGIVHRLGEVPAPDLPRWINACDVLAMPNRDIAGDSEGFGMVFIEAAACGKPSLAGAAGGTGSAVVHEKTGLRVDGDSVDAVTSGLRRLLQNPDWAAALGLAGRQRVVEEFAWDEVARATRARVLERRRT